MLWAACQALGRAVKVALPGASPDKPVRPLEPEIKAVTKAAREFSGNMTTELELKLDCIFCSTSKFKNNDIK